MLKPTQSLALRSVEICMAAFGRKRRNGLCARRHQEPGLLRQSCGGSGNFGGGTAFRIAQFF